MCLGIIVFDNTIDTEAHMGKLAANWPYFLLSQIVKGKFFLKPELAIGLGHQVARILANKDEQEDNTTAERRIEILCIDDRGKEKRLLYDEDPNENMGSRYDEAPAGSVAIIPVKGTLLKYGTWCDYGTLELANIMIEAASHKNISSLVLDHDSGGGAVDAVPPMVQAIRRVKEMKKPIVSSIDLACSAAYWTASETDYLVLDNDISAEVGSIGVMMSFYDVQPMYEEMGIKFHSIYSNESGDKNLAFQEALKGNYDLIKEESLDPLARNFQATIKKNRAGKLNASVPGIISGKTFYAQDALKHGLVDRIGNSMTAVEIALAMSHARKFI